jgi:hypothetical protein
VVVEDNVGDVEIPGLSIIVGGEFLEVVAGAGYQVRELVLLVDHGHDGAYILIRYFSNHKISY